MACTVEELTEAAKCYNCLSHHDKLAAIIYYLCLAQICAGEAPCDISTITEDGACITCVPRETRLSIDVYNAFQMASNGGAPVVGTIDEITAGIECIKCLPQEVLDALKTLYSCRIAECVAAV